MMEQVSSEESASPKSASRKVPREKIQRVTVRFAGDSGDGIQVTGGQFSTVTAIAGNDLATFPDFPAEIRAPAGSLPGVSGFQIQFSSYDIHTPGDRPEVLVVFNPAALKTNLPSLAPNGTLIVNRDEFTEKNLEKAEYKTNPLEDGSLAGLRVVQLPMTTMTVKALEDAAAISHKDRERCRNFFALGVVCWLYNRPIEPIEKWIRGKFAKSPEFVEANTRVLRTGYNYADTIELFQVAYEVPAAHLKPGTYKNISGTLATAYGLLTASKKSGLRLVYCGYPITPASDLLHELAGHRNFGVITMQAEDEIASMNAAIGASFAGSLGVTGTSGPGLALKSEAVNLAVMTELPVVIFDVMRAGPSTGMPTKTEQADLLFALFGRPSESPLPILAAATPSDCFDTAIEAVRIAVQYMTPVIVLTDLYLVFGSEPWLIRRPADIPSIEVGPRHRFDNGKRNGSFQPYERDPKTLARPWAIPGTPGFEHRLGGIEKSHIHGHVSYDPANHDFMCRLRAEKVGKIAQDIPPQEVFGPEKGDLLVVGWGSTFGAIRTAVEQAVGEGSSVAHLHLRHLNPLPSDVGEILSRYRRVLVAENNLGQLLWLLRAKFLVDAAGYGRITGQPFSVNEIRQQIQTHLKEA